LILRQIHWLILIVRARASFHDRLLARSSHSDLALQFLAFPGKISANAFYHWLNGVQFCFIVGQVLDLHAEFRILFS